MLVETNYEIETLANTVEQVEGLVKDLATALGRDIQVVEGLMPNLYPEERVIYDADADLCIGEWWGPGNLVWIKPVKEADYQPQIF